MNEINIFKDDLKNDIDFINLYTEVTNELKEDDMNKILSPIIHTLKENDPAISFIEEVNQIKLLSIEQEKELFQQVAKGKHAKEKVDLFNKKKIIINEAELDILNELVIEYIIDYKLSIDYFKLLKKEILIYFIIILIIKVINLIELK